MIYLYSLKQKDKTMYIGLTNNPDVRKTTHKRKRPPHTFTILENIEDVTEATERERELIEEYETYLSGWNKSPGGEYEQNSGYDRKGIGGVKKGQIPWNKGKSGCFSEESIQKMKNTRKGVRYSSKLNESKVKDIRKEFLEHPTINGVGEVQGNGIKLTQERAFANKYHSNYGITNINLYNIIIGKSWKNI